MGSSNGHPTSKYSVSLTGPANAKLVRIGEAATSLGIGKLIRKVYRRVLLRLKSDAADFGEPLYRIQSMRMTIRCAAVTPLYIEYGIHDVQPIVVIRRVVALSDPIS